jgi:hypothetical protein
MSTGIPRREKMYTFYKKKSSISHQAKRRIEGKHLSPRNMNACHSMSIAPRRKEIIK